MPDFAFAPSAEPGRRFGAGSELPMSAFGTYRAFCEYWLKAGPDGENRSLGRPLPYEGRHP